MQEDAGPESVLFVLRAERVTDHGWVVGRIMVTATALRFDSHVPSAAHAVVVPLVFIAGVRSSNVGGFTINGLEILDRRGGALQFIVEDPDRWTRHLEAAIATHGRQGVYR